MNIVPKAAPAAPAAQPTPAVSARERAMAAFMGGQPSDNDNPVQNPSSVSPEEMTAIRRPHNTVETSDESQDAVVETASEELEASEQVADESVEVEDEKPSIEEETLRKQQAALLRQEKQLRLRSQRLQQEIKAKEQDLAQREAAMKAKEQEYISGYISKASLQRNPLAVLSDLGISYDQITEAALTQQAIPPQMQSYIEKLEAKIQSLEKATEETKTSQTEAQKQAYEAAVNQIRTDVKSLVSQDPAFEMIKATRSFEDVVDLIKQVHAEEGILLSVDEACQQVEDYLLEEAEKLTRLEKIQKRLKPAGSAQPKGQSATEQRPATTEQRQSAKTLTNAASASRPLSARERAIAAFQGKLK